MAALTQTNLPTLPLLSRGKVRDLYGIPSSPNQLLVVATDRISAFDVVLENGIPGKGKILTQLSVFWFKKLADIIPSHFITDDISQMPPEVQPYRDQLEGRAMLVHKARVVPLEAIVRGYLSGSAYVEYKASGTVHGMAAPSGMLESQRFPDPIFTPSTKAEPGAHDENISHDKAREIVGEETFERIKETALRLYSVAASHTLEHAGIILADTKFEFGWRVDPNDHDDPVLMVIDEVVTPDSSRYWPAEDYVAGKPQPSLDKQYLRDWLRSKTQEPTEGRWKMDDKVIEGTRKRYEQVAKMLLSFKQ